MGQVVLWISDAGTSTGFSRVTHEIGERLVRQFGHEIHVLAIGYDASYPVNTNLRLYRASAGPAGTYLGLDRVVELIDHVNPGVVVTLEDPAVLLARLRGNTFDRTGRLAKLPILAYLPVDGYNLPPAFLDLKELTHVVAMSKHGQLQLGGDVPLIYHGVDTDTFRPVDVKPITTSGGQVLETRADCREAFSIPQEAFVIGRFDTNSGRKDWGATWRVIEYFLGNPRRPPTVVSIFHTKLRGDGVDLEALISKREGGKYIVTGGGDWPIDDLVALINCWDVGLTTSRGEGFGFFGAETIACGVPVIATRGSATTEVLGPGGVLVDAADVFWANPYGVEMLVADAPRMAQQLQYLSMREEVRRHLGALGREHVQQFSWDIAAEQMHREIEALVDAVREQQRAAVGSS